MKQLIIFFILVILISCRINKETLIKFSNKKIKKYKINSSLLKDWHYKDIAVDSIPGISLDRAYQELIKNKKGKEIVVAVIDTQLDLNHEDLKDAVWINKDEIPNNNIDDDNNDYIDDINGWNFLGYGDDKSVQYSNFEFVRIIKRYDSMFSDSTKLVTNNLKYDFLKYKRAKKIYKQYFDNYNLELSSMIFTQNLLDSARFALKVYFPNNNFNIVGLDSIKSNNKIIKKHIDVLKFCLENNYMDSYLSKQISKDNKYLEYYLNLSYDERMLVGDDLNDINDNVYGLNNTNIDSLNLGHATKVSGFLVNLKGSTQNKTRNNIKIMPISVSCYGDEHDKDIALAIRYAVDNGARIINMSSSKEFSLDEAWVHSALKFASDNNVLFITSAGNKSYNLDIHKYYPNDINFQNKEFVSNFISVGATTKFSNKKLKSSSSNFGKKNVDIFAPGKNIYTSIVRNKYGFVSGTSHSTPIVSGVAALVMSYYPKLKAHQVKEILLASGVSYDIDVEITGEDGKKKLVPFSSLSKSGKIVNAYNALLYAKNYKKWKAGKWPKK